MLRKTAIVLILGSLVAFTWAGEGKKCGHANGIKAECCTKQDGKKCKHVKKCIKELEKCKKACSGNQECIDKCKAECRAKCKYKGVDEKKCPSGIKPGNEASIVPKGTPQTLCPVMGGTINKASFVDVNNKRIYVCCAGCIDAVKKEPEKYIKQMTDAGILLENVPN